MSEIIIENIAELSYAEEKVQQSTWLATILLIRLIVGIERNLDKFIMSLGFINKKGSNFPSMSLKVHVYI